MNRHEHYEAAEALAGRVAAVMGNAIDGLPDENGMVTVAEEKLEIAAALTALAQVHATLANVPI